MGNLGEDVPDPHWVRVDQGIVKDHGNSVIGVNEAGRSQSDHQSQLIPLQACAPQLASHHRQSGVDLDVEVLTEHGPADPVDLAGERGHIGLTHLVEVTAESFVQQPR